MELVDTHALGACIARCEGSSPFSPTNFFMNTYIRKKSEQDPFSVSASSGTVGGDHPDGPPPGPEFTARQVRDISKLVFDSVMDGSWEKEWALIVDEVEKEVPGTKALYQDFTL